jgi:spore maturation protein CgeB
MMLNIVVFGLSITSSWGNGHAVTYRALLKALAARGHTITFIERDVPWYRDHRDLNSAPYCKIELYSELRDIPARFGSLIAEADMVILGSFVPEGAILGDWITSAAEGVTAFYDIDTPFTLEALRNRSIDYLTPNLIPRFDLYLSFTGGPMLDLLETQYGSPCARALYCTADATMQTARETRPPWALGYLGTYSADRQAGLDRLLIEPARRLKEARFVVAGAQYPADIAWSDNVSRIAHLPPRDHPGFYRRQAYTLNLTRADMVAAGYSPSVRLFEAAAYGTPIISDRWDGIDTFFAPGKEILLTGSANEVVTLLTDLPEKTRREIAASARRRFLAEHTPAHRARDLESYYATAAGVKPAPELTEDVA